LGKVKPTYIKRVGNYILQNHPELVTHDFEENKKLLAELGMPKVFRNRVAGYMTRAKREKTGS
jgi:ribosomal protein S17E